MDFKQELKFLFPLPFKTEGRRIFNLKLRQVLTFLSYVDEPLELEEFLLSEHGTASSELLNFYNGCSLLLTFPEEENKSVSTQTAAAKTDLLFITASIHLVCEEFHSSWQEVLDMDISHYHLVLKFIKEKREEELKEIRKNKGKK